MCIFMRNQFDYSGYIERVNMRLLLNAAGVCYAYDLITGWLRLQIGFDGGMRVVLNPDFQGLFLTFKSFQPIDIDLSKKYNILRSEGEIGGIFFFLHNKLAAAFSTSSKPLKGKFYE